MSYRLLEITTHVDARGALSVAEGDKDVPFPIARMFWIHQVLPGTRRGGHAHRILHQVLICMSGALDVLVDDGARSEIFRLDRPDRALHLPPLVWAEETVLTAGTAYAVLASHAYDPAEYLRTRDAWKAAL